MSKPASRANVTDRRTLSRSCVRPSASSTCGTIDCTPNDTRFTPASRYAANNAVDTVSGLHSTVTSAPGARTTAERTDTSSSAGSNDGVPPPKNTDVADVNDAHSTSNTHAAA